MGEICIDVLTKRNSVSSLSVSKALDLMGCSCVWSGLLLNALEARRDAVYDFNSGLSPNSPATGFSSMDEIGLFLT